MLALNVDQMECLVPTLLLGTTIVSCLLVSGFLIFSLSLFRISLGNRVARVEGPNHVEVEELLERYQFQNSRLDLFSEHAVEPWGDRKVKDPSRTPRTTARFVPGYDWNKDRGFFDDLADKAQADFEQQFGNWLPNTEDE